MIALTRLPDWRQRLDDYLDSIDGKPFRWGELDCALFAADCVQAMTGVDLAADFRGLYTDQEGAEAAIKVAGHDTYAELVSSLLPLAEGGKHMIGDVAVVESPAFGPCLGIVGGMHIHVMTLRGKGALPLARASRIFRVG